MKIIPAILPKNFEELKQKIALVLHAVDIVQIDFCDGSFSRTVTWPFNKKDSYGLGKILDEEDGLPYWQDMNFEFDLMVADGMHNFDKYLQMGPSSIVFHLKKEDDTQIFAEFLEGIDIYARENVKIGIAIETTDGIDRFSAVIPHVDFVQCMGIEHIGYQGQEFDERVLDQIKMVHDKFPNIEISVDGGVTLETAPHLIAAGASRLVVGSAIFGSIDPVEAIKEFEYLGN